MSSPCTKNFQLFFGRKVLSTKDLGHFAPGVFEKNQGEKEKKEERVGPRPMPCIVLPML
jgi:hypothetical protein